MFRKLLLSLMFLGALACSASAQATGLYDVEGQNPDKTTYVGSVSVEKTDETYRVVWTIGGERYIGIGNDDAMAISYRAGNNTGVAFLARDKGKYVLVWTYLGGTTIGAERWLPRKG
jgi:hypothetical protein